MSTSRVASILFLGAAYLLFMWMFFATEAFSHSVARQHLLGLLTSQEKHQALRFGTAWRHGMEGGWPLYMPGFFMLSMALVWWSLGRPSIALVTEWILLVTTATIVAMAPAPIGSRLIRDAFHRTCECDPIPIVFEVTGADVGTALLTVGCWSLFVLLIVRAIERRKLRLVLLATLPYSALYFRWGDAQVLTEEWSNRAFRGEILAILSLIMIPVVTVGIVWIVRRRCPLSSAPLDREVHQVPSS